MASLGSFLLILPVTVDLLGTILEFDVEIARARVRSSMGAHGSEASLELSLAPAARRALEDLRRVQRLGFTVRLGQLETARRIRRITAERRQWLDAAIRDALPIQNRRT